MPPLIRLEHVSKSYQEGTETRSVLRDTNVAIEAGQLVAIRGRSGSGKSTLLNLLAGLDVPTTGDVFVEEACLNRLSAKGRTVFRRDRLGFVFQFFNLIPTLPVLENVLLPVVLERRPSGNDRQHALELLTSVGLADRLSNNMHQLSGGELQRVAVARALVLQPPVLLADEPTGNLDSATGAALLRLLKQTCKQRGTTIVMVTHDRHAAGIADRLLSLRDGRIASDQLMSQTALEAS
jgi:putative ABC transport system ATP-binding protein